MKRNLFYFMFVAIAIVFTACQKDDDGKEGVETLDVKIKVGESFKLDGSDFTTDENLNAFVASISNLGEIKGLHDGETSCTVKSKDKTYKLNIAVSANTTLYVDMKIYMGVSRTDIEKIYGKPVQGDSLLAMYKPIAKELLNSFTYENDTVVTGTVALKSGLVSSLNNHLADRYKFLKTSEGVKIYIDALSEADAKTMVGMSLKSSNIYVTYMPVSELKSLESTSENRLETVLIAAFRDNKLTDFE